MLITSFKTYSPSAIVKVPLFALFLWAFSPIYHTASGLLPVVGQMPIYQALSEVTNRFYYVSMFLSLCLSVLSAFWINYIVNQHNLLPRKTYLPALFYLLYTGFCGTLLTLHPVLLANLLLIAASHELFNTYRKDSALSETFNAGMLIGIASLLYLPALFLFLFIWVTLILFRPFIWQEYVVALLGLCLPWIYAFAYFFMHGTLSSLTFHLLKGPFREKEILFPVSRPYIWLYIILGSVVLGALVRIVNSSQVMPLKTKKTFSLLFWCFLLSGISIYPNSIIGPPALLLTAIPLSVFVSNFFLQIRRAWVAEVLFSLMLLAILGVHLSLLLKK
jgi:hypothetical protein